MCNAEAGTGVEFQKLNLSAEAVWLWQWQHVRQYIVLLLTILVTAGDWGYLLCQRPDTVGALKPPLRMPLSASQGQWEDQHCHLGPPGTKS